MVFVGSRALLEGFGVVPQTPRRLADVRVDMMISQRLHLVATLVAIALLSSTVPVVGAQELFRYYPETGHYVNGEWLAWYLAKGGPDVIGAPRTEDYRELDRLVQYFRTIRLEWDCGSDGRQPCVLRPGNLGEEILGKRLDLTPDRIFPGVLSGDNRVFSDVGLVVRGDFLDLYDRLGGLDFFGYPLTDPRIEAGHTVQWFQRARIERDASGGVTLSALGDYWIDTLKRVPLVNTLRVPGPAAAPAAPATSPRIGGTVAYRSADGAIVLLGADGDERIVASGGEPALSPDHSRLAFVRNGSDQAGIWLVDLATGEERGIATEYGARSPA